MEKKISIFVCGVQKAGTTSLYSYFKSHPQLSAPKKKEIHFFDREKRNWDAPNFSRLNRFFARDDNDRLRFDITPIYCYWPPAMERLYNYNPDAKIIILFRDPFERALSHWSMQFSRGNETIPFDEAMREEGPRIERAGDLSRQSRRFSYVRRGFYAEQVRRVLAFFPRDNVLFLQSTDLLQDHTGTLARIAGFLGIEPFPKLKPIIDHKREKINLKVEPKPEDYAWVARLVKDDLPIFAKLSGLDIAAWPTMREIDALGMMERAAAD